MNEMTVVLLNWKRPDNLRRTIDSLVAQTSRPRIFLWNNSPTGFSHPAIDWWVNSSENKRCWPRWMMASMADTPYVMSLDDDLMFTDKEAIEHLVCLLERCPDDRIYGTEGVVLRDGFGYCSGYGDAYGLPGDCVPVDVVKGRLMAFKREALRKYIHMHWAVTEDDIALCGLLAQGRSQHHRLSPMIRHMTKEQPEEHALWRQPGHFDRREAAVKAFFPWRK